MKTLRVWRTDTFTNHFSGLGRAIGSVCLCVWTVTFELSCLCHTLGVNQLKTKKGVDGYLKYPVSGQIVLELKSGCRIMFPVH